VQVFYNNVLSLPLIAVLMWWYGELKTLQFEPALQNPIFLFAACASSLVRLLIVCLGCILKVSYFTHDKTLQVSTAESHIILVAACASSLQRHSLYSIAGIRVQDLQGQSW